MASLLDEYLHPLLIFLMVLTRIGGLVLGAPIFGPRHVPMRARVFLMVALALIVTPLHLEATFGDISGIVPLAIALGREAALGLALGLALTMFFSGMHVAGQVIGQMSGMQLADAFDPQFDSEVSLFGQFLDLIAMAVFVASHGHRKVVAALLDTFRWRPPGGDSFPASLLETLVDVLTQSWIVGIRAGAPVMVSLLLAVLVLGFISRTLPQLNVFVVGFNVNAAVLLAALAFSLATISVVVEEQADAILAVIRDAVSGI